MSALQVSVVIPSYNRRSTLELVLEGLAKQTVPAETCEVIVVLDGSSDGSAEMLTAWQQSGRLANLRWQLQANRGQATARNTGANMAQAPILLFLDDDIVPEPDLIAVHLGHHTHQSPRAVLGDCLVVRERQDSMYHLYVWAWWEDRYHQRALPGRQPGFRDFLTGNVSLRRQDFLQVGGFDPDFRGYGGEDFELGYRLLQAGVEFIADRKARAYHYHRTTVEGVLRATRQEAHGDIILGEKHPELRQGLRLICIPTGRYGWLVRLALKAPQFGDILTAALRSVLPLFERTKMRRRWLAYFNHVRGYAYWRGVREALGSWEALLAYQAGAMSIPSQVMDISRGLPQDLPALWVNGPSEIELIYHGAHLGHLQLEKSIEDPLYPYLTKQIIHQLSPQLWQAVSREVEPAWNIVLPPEPQYVHCASPTTNNGKRAPHD